MSNINQATDQLTSIRLLKIIKKWRKQLLNTFLITAVVSFIITLPVFMKPIFKSSAIIYPANIQPYSKETQTEQLVQLLNSEDVRDSVVKAFNLYKHYDIDTGGAYPRFEMMKRLDENISINKTQFESVAINVYDTDPDTAALVCMGIIKFTDLKAISLIRDRAAENYIINNNLLLEKKAQLDSMENLMYEIRTKYGILDYENQITGFSREYYKYEGSGGANSKMDQERKNLEEKGGAYVTLKENLWRVRGAYNDYKLKNEIILSDMHKDLQFHNMITRPSVPEKKDSPKRALYMVLFTVSVMFFALLVILYKEQIQKKLELELKDVN